MSRTLFVGNLPFRMSNDDLRAHFEAVAAVESAHIILDRETSRPRGFGFVTMQDEGGAQRALRLDGALVLGRPLIVSIARERATR